ncbi:hypothetical protein BZG36_03965 [Bifiguratus adelaidae]|uniref:Vacuolar calcium ion transporter n=1 Tax=Bifiguratus adelaidae TaxID=1938954 RepID=A0A261XXC2_9FUNG|nr:hypothetical protein BZG36_03965 [Bifiguratus adelaidae]
MSERQPLLYTHPPSLSSNFSGANARGLRNIFFGSYFNLGLLFIPFGAASQLAHWEDTATFALNFLAIIPLARLLGIATEELALRAGSTIGGLLNATFGNAIELILGLVALKEGLIRVVQASVLGSMLSNILLARWTRKEQVFNMTAAQTSSSLLALTCLSLLVPAAFVGSISTDNDMKQPRGNSQHYGTGIGDISLEDKILSLSRGTAVVMLLVYGMFLFFQASLKTHSHLYEEEADSDDEGEPTINTVTSVLLLIGVTLLVAMHAEFLVGSIEGIVSQWHLTETFVGIILLPIVGNAAEHVSSVTFAIKNKMDLCIGVAIGSSMQIGLFLTPALVLAGWIIGQPMTLYFHMFETTVLLVSVLVVNYLLQDGKSNWLEGAMLLSSYVIIGIAFFYYPANSG